MANKYDFPLLQQTAKRELDHHLRSWLDKAKLSGPPDQDAAPEKDICDIAERIRNLSNAKYEHPLVTSLITQTDVCESVMTFGTGGLTSSLLMEAYNLVSDFDRNFFLHMMKKATVSKYERSSAVALAITESATMTRVK